MLTVELLQAAVECKPALAERYAGPLSEACALFEINTPQRLAMFLANVAHESGALRYVEEVWGPTEAQKRYEGRRDLGNTQPGDGERYKGHGLLQTTGRANHRELKAALLLAGYEDVPDFEADPQALTQPRWAAASAGYFWHSRRLNALADAGDFAGVVRKINGGTNGMEDRIRRLAIAQKALAGLVDKPADSPIQSVDKPSISPTWRAPTGDADIPDIPQEASMPSLTSVLGGAITAANPIAGLIFSVLAPAVQAKIDKEVARHDDHPEVAKQISDALVVAAQQATGQKDPLQAAAAVQRDPAAAVSASATVAAKLDELMPLFDKIDEIEQRAFEAQEAAIATARKFNSDEPNIIDSPWLKLKFAHILSIAMMGFAGWFAMKFWPDLSGELRGSIITLMVVGGWNGVKDYWFGSSRSSAAKDAANAQLQQQMQQRGK